MNPPCWASKTAVDLNLTIPLSEPESPRGKMLKYNTAEMLQAQAAGQWDRRRGDVLQRNLDESLRILRDKSAAFKRRFRARDM